ncbi:YbcC family protein [Methyloversatilis thermotolerans]|uniref:YbcC family protein n=1 Tax=Methyloversatilis thermotolerans TaxID=1346290 RepID=UPI000362102B
MRDVSAREFEGSVPDATDTTGAQPDALQVRIDAACNQACAAIAPAWPLDQAIAVNPHWARTGLPVRTVAARMAVLAGIRVFPSRHIFREAWDSGRIGPADLAQALASLPAPGEPLPGEAQCVAALRAEPQVRGLPLLIDVLDDDPARHERLSWRQAITHQVSQTCAAYFDTHQADWQPDRGCGLYAFWRDTLTHDHGIGVLMGLPDLSRCLHALPADRAQAERWVLQRLGLPETVWADYLEAVLLTVNGWASWCAYLGWQAALSGRQDPHLRELLAIRLAWGVLLLESKDDLSARRSFAALQDAWTHAGEVLAEAERVLLIDEVWQSALDIVYQRELAARLASASSARQLAAGATAPEVLAAFCIDVRSEPMRRALEAAWPAIRTLGFAGFFGLPIAYTPLASNARRPQLPGLLAPALEVSEQIDADDRRTPPSDERLREVASARHRSFAGTRPWQAATRWPGAAFSFVEAAGISYVGKLARWIRPSPAARPRDDLSGLPARYREACRPGLSGVDLTARVDLAARVLRAMGLDRDLAALVLLIGHGSQSANNAHAAALDCGACCGQTGEVNARTLARLLNDGEVRAALATQGIAVPSHTAFVACLHNTTTDEIEGFDLDLLPEQALARWRALLPVFAQAGDQVRRERAQGLGLDPREGSLALLERLRRRANDGAQTRPEWGLAGNAAFIIAPRWRSEATVLAGRTFLHDYDSTRDTDGSLLELLMTAPMLVTHWINWQYHASTCEPDHYGSGNKLLHNVVGGRIGVFEGNGGDLRIGLARQSVHDGARWVHEPVRLTVVIDAPAAAIERVIAQHEVVRRLVDNGWLHLWRFDQERLQRYRSGQWQALSFEPAPDARAINPTLH